MVGAIKQAAQNYFNFRKEAKRINKEIDEKGIYYYVQEKYEKEEPERHPMTPKHA